MPEQNTATALAGETLDEICWRTLGHTAGATEQTLALNPGMADLGPCLPAGTLVVLPSPAAVVPVLRESVSLWD